MKKLFAIALCAAMALSLAACSSGSEKEESSGTQTDAVQTEGEEASGTAESSSSGSIAPAGTTETVNPYIDCQTLEEAQELAGLTWNVPEEIGGSTERLFRAMENEMLEVVYKTGTAETARIRKAPGTDNISGSSEEFAQSEAVDVGSSKVNMKGQDDLMVLATWNDDAYTYSVSLETGVSREEMSQLVLSLQEKETV